jgi:hypothetical protein
MDLDLVILSREDREGSSSQLRRGSLALFGARDVSLEANDRR